MDSVYTLLLSEADKIRIIDTHEHLPFSFIVAQDVLVSFL